ncbi:hypothetical protein [Spartinivicinus ruber]|uniref:hypothetical protein n=1 Tax=Spartinivicinus ruber TaxID=2683272 RepID=UPI0013D13B61|nr:hypothetical protein [Spartinivicinus ruber]
MAPNTTTSDIGVNHSIISEKVPHKKIHHLKISLEFCEAKWSNKENNKLTDRAIRFQLTAATLVLSLKNAKFDIHSEDELSYMLDLEMTYKLNENNATERSSTHEANTGLGIKGVKPYFDNKGMDKKSISECNFRGYEYDNHFCIIERNSSNPKKPEWRFKSTKINHPLSGKLTKKKLGIVRSEEHSLEYHSSFIVYCNDIIITHYPKYKIPFSGLVKVYLRNKISKLISNKSHEYYLENSQ